MQFLIQNNVPRVFVSFKTLLSIILCRVC